MKELVPVNPNELQPTNRLVGKDFLIANGKKIERSSLNDVAVALGFVENEFEFKGINEDSSAPSEGKTGLYFPLSAGTYVNYGGIVVTQNDWEENILFIVYDGKGFELVKKPIDFVPKGNIEPGNNASVSGEKVYEWTNKSVKNISDLRSYEGREGEIITLLGYYEAGDKEPLNYKWTSEQGVDDGGSVINTESGRWEAVFGTEIDCIHFGLKDNSTDLGIIIDKVINYCTLNKIKNIIVSNNDLIVNEPVLISCNNINIIYKSDTFIKLNDLMYNSILLIEESNNLNIYGFKLDGNNNGNQLDNGTFLVNNVDVGVNTNTALINVINSENCNIEKCNVKNSFCAPIVLIDCNNSNIKYCYSENHNREGFGIKHGYKNTISNNRSLSTNNSSWSLYFTAGNELDPYFEHHHNILNNYAENSQAAFLTINTNNTKVEGNYVCKTLGDDYVSGAGIRLGHDAVGFSAYNSNVSNNIIKGLKPNAPFFGSSGDRGISLENASNSVIIDNYISDCNSGIGASVTLEQNQISIINNNILKTTKIAIDDFYSLNTVIKNNYINDCSKGIVSRSKNVVIDSNIIVKNSDVGISILFGGNPDLGNYMLINNSVDQTIGVIEKYILQGDSNVNNIIRNNIGHLINRGIQSLRPVLNSGYAGYMYFNTSISEYEIWNGSQWLKAVKDATITTTGLVKVSLDTSNITTSDATDLSTAIALVNELKDKLNSKLTADRDSGQQQTI